ncbi:hypothetical protein SEUCBS140593_005414 [Sporothrix eucalyptigena]|uniref:Major facilitator superfamily (MFS) profile domain-containing protein n=1 Tax=Sporothrix eucalyptigena TaxID=1812306 RepID=A0ABP0BWX5_9PEZI
MEAYTSYNLWVILFASGGSVFAGFGLAVIANTIGQPSFYKTMNLVEDSTAPGYSHTSTILGAANGIFFAGGFFGTLLSAWAGDRVGRVNGFRIASLTGIIGGALQSGAINVPMFLVARLVTGIASGHTMAAMPIYYAEVSAPHSRGMLTGSHSGFIALGYSLAGWIGYGCYYAEGTSFAWRFPNAVLCLVALILLAGSFFIPESPRWLVQHDRNDEALAILCKLHHDRTDAEDQFAKRELLLIQNQLDLDRQTIENGGRWQLFTMKTYRKRIILALAILAGGQDIGGLVINNYSVLLYETLGLSNAMALLLGAVYVTVGMCCNFGGAFISDKIGRRVALLGGLILTVSMFTVATALIGTYNTHPSKAVSAASIVFVYIYIVCYAIYDGSQFTAATEIFPSHLRSQATSIATSIIFLLDTLWLEIEPTALDTIGWKYYAVFIGTGIAHIFLLYFILPDTSGMALEEIDAVFGKEAAGHLNNDTAFETAYAVTGETKDDNAKMSE